MPSPPSSIADGLITGGGLQNRLSGFGQGPKQDFLIYILVNRILKPSGAIPVYRLQSQKTSDNPGRI
jgi:hypothetical protein